MHLSSLPVALAALCGFCCMATDDGQFHLEKRVPPAVVSLPFDLTSPHGPSVPAAESGDGLRKRDSKTYREVINNEKNYISANLSLGTPPQSVRCLVDTGSSDLWVNDPNTHICRERGHPCSISGTFDRSKSSSYKHKNNDFNISYVDQSGASGAYGTDILRFGRIKLDSFQFGIGNVSTSANSVLGIGYPINEAYVAKTGNKPYPNLLQALVDAGLINSKAYSIYLNDFDAKQGEILFGGINTAKFQGRLATLPIVPHGSKTYAELKVAMTGLAVYDHDQFEQLQLGARSINAVIDSGSTFCALPTLMARQLYRSLGAVYNAREGLGLIDCSLRNQDAGIKFTFSGASITVPMKEMILDPRDFDIKSRHDVCFFGIIPIDANDGSAILGDTFLRSAYVVYDLDNNEISLAQAAIGKGGSTSQNAPNDNIVEIKKGPQGVSSATGTASPDSFATDSTTPTGSPTKTSGASPDKSSSTSSASTTKTNDAPVPVPLAAGSMFAWLLGMVMVTAIVL